MRGYIRNGVTEPPGWCHMRTVTAAQDQLLKVPHQLQKVAESPGPEDSGIEGAAIRHGKRALVLAVCCSALFMTGLDNTIVNVGLPSIGRSLHTSVAGLQWTLAA